MEKGMKYLDFMAVYMLGASVGAICSYLFRVKEEHLFGLGLIFLGTSLLFFFISNLKDLN